jgi:hypothetical protein
LSEIAPFVDENGPHLSLVIAHVVANVVRYPGAVPRPSVLAPRHFRNFLPQAIYIDSNRFSSAIKASSRWLSKLHCFAESRASSGVETTDAKQDSHACVENN